MIFGLWILDRSLDFILLRNVDVGEVLILLIISFCIVLWFRISGGVWLHTLDFPIFHGPLFAPSKIVFLFVGYVGKIRDFLLTNFFAFLFVGVFGFLDVKFSFMAFLHLWALLFALS